MHDSINRAGNRLFSAAYLFISLPFIIFLLFWTRLYIGLPLAALVFFCVMRLSLRAPEICLPQINLESIGKYALIFGVILIWTAFSGIGKIAYQNGDHVTRNGVFELLVNSKWPVINYNPPQGLYPNPFTEPVALTYYFGFWLVPALFGKVFGLSFGYFFQVIWASVGIYIFFMLALNKFIKKLAVWPLVIFIFFSGLDVVGMMLTGKKLSELPLDTHFEGWANQIGIVVQYSSFTTQLFWVFNQAIPAFISTMLIISQKDNRAIAFIIAVTLISSVFPSFGLAFLAVFLIGKSIYKTLSEKEENGKFAIKKLLFDHISIENVTGIIAACIAALFYFSNSSVETLKLRELKPFLPGLLFNITFFAIEAGVYLALVYKSEKRSLLWWSALASLLVFCLMCTAGTWNDFTMRASIPALIITWGLLIKELALNHSFKKVKTYIIAGILIIGMVTPMGEIIRSAKGTFSALGRGASASIIGSDPINAERTSKEFYSGINGSAFWRYIGKK